MNWEPPNGNVLAFFKSNEVLFLDSNCPLRFYLGFSNGISVVICEAAYDAEAVGLYDISTRKEYRNYGFATAIIVAHKCLGRKVEKLMLLVSIF
ncbi:hypothetical protein [Leptospira alstonii]|uniref:N-acetyltransferase domain-containing protein n=2 Tax=Leptospira alstonii TaxID=28452 RepID=M6CGJ8_9LEPT|nr:hypothetical protein [Leptospira alstonii]EMJ90977.1 hypothetical protein LEP1GSC194_1290 [Leptospira alstonii serovar Sichuan str. 79601]EQA81902.1 hypothetical protein LEP1GSC193_1364 [Leptospira alstonii serovar Pingchang str. 80-412]